MSIQYCKSYDKKTWHILEEHKSLQFCACGFDTSRAEKKEKVPTDVSKICKNCMKVLLADLNYLIKIYSRVLGKALKVVPVSTKKGK